MNSSREGGAELGSIEGARMEADGPRLDGAATSAGTKEGRAVES